eukprot:scaffold194091_cov18-Prasinocladus_malaysianus.AAC.2
MRIGHLLSVAFDPDVDSGVTICARRRHKLDGTTDKQQIISIIQLQPTSIYIPLHFDVRTSPT